jgi:hypothetical protein
VRVSVDCSAEGTDVPLWTSFATMTPDERRERARATRDAEAARVANRQAYIDELAGLLMRVAQNQRELDRIAAELETAAPHFRTMLETERDQVLGNIDYLQGRADLVRLEIKRFEK